MVPRSAFVAALLAVLGLSWSEASHAFAFQNRQLQRQPQRAFALSSSSLSTMESPLNLLNKELPFYADMKSTTDETTLSSSTTSSADQAKAFLPKKAATKAKGKGGGGAVHKQGVFSPVVMASKVILGEDKLNQLRAKAISMHGDVIKTFVDSSETALGNKVLQQLFSLADANRSGTIDVDELKVALRALGFDWLKEEKVQGIFARADTDANGAIDLDEWIKEAPKTLKTNLVKLAKKNGGDMGLLV